jgi:hypothetical protein
MSCFSPFSLEVFLDSANLCVATCTQLSAAARDGHNAWTVPVLHGHVRWTDLRTAVHLYFITAYPVCLIFCTIDAHALT